MPAKSLANKNNCCLPSNNQSSSLDPCAHSNLIPGPRGSDGKDGKDGKDASDSWAELSGSPSDNPSVSSFMDLLFDDPDAETARNTLKLGVSDDVEFNTLKVVDVVKTDPSVGSFYISAAAVTFLPDTNGPLKAEGSTTLIRAKDFDSDGGVNNRLRYIGAETRQFFVSVDISLEKDSGSPANIQISIYKNGFPETGLTVLNEASGTDIMAVSVSGPVELAQNDYVEVWVESDNDDFLVFDSMVLTAFAL